MLLIISSQLSGSAVTFTQISLSAGSFIRTNNNGVKGTIDGGTINCTSTSSSYYCINNYGHDALTINNIDLDAKYGIKNNKVLVLEINLTHLLDMPVGQVKFKVIPRFPVVTRDLALLVDPDMKVAYLTYLIKKNGGALVRDVKVFDIYVDASLNAKKSVGVTITLAKDDMTLKDEEINDTIEKITTMLLKENIQLQCCLKQSFVLGPS